MAWLTQQNVLDAGKTDKYYVAGRWTFYEAVIAFLKEKGIGEKTRVLELGPRSLPLLSTCTVVDRKIMPGLRERHKGLIIEGWCDRVGDMSVLCDHEVDITIACQIFEHLHEPLTAWEVIKRVTKRGVVITFPWRWKDSPDHNRDMRDLASWTHGEAPLELRRIGCRMLAWFKFS